MKHDKRDPIIRAALIHGNKYDYTLFEYQTMHTKSTIMCPEHGPFQRTMADHIYGKCGCPKCKYDKMIASRKGGNARLTYKVFVERANSKFPSQSYDYSNVEYVNMHTPVDIYCPTHGIWSITPSDHLNGNRGAGSGCPKCSPKVSGPERIILNFLENENISYVFQATFPGLVSDKQVQLSYDFFIPQKNLLIEYDGKQHREYVSIFKNQSLERTFYLDELKTQFALDNNIVLKRIPHTIKTRKDIIQELERLLQ